MNSEMKESLYNLPPSAKLVFKVLEEEQKLTQKELASYTLLAPRTIRYALNQLQEINIVRQDVNLMDARQRIYSLERENCESVPSAA